MRGPDGVLVKRREMSNEGKFNITGLKAYTEYTVTLEALNNQELSSFSSQQITTVALCKYSCLCAKYILVSVSAFSIQIYYIFEKAKCK